MFGLGDSSYPKYNWVGKKLHRRLELLGAKPITEKGEADDQNDWGCVLSCAPWLALMTEDLSLESTFPDWLDQFISDIDAWRPPPSDFAFRPANELPPPRVRLSRPATPAEPSTLSRWTPDNRWAKIVANERVTPSDWFQDVRRIELQFASVEDLECVATVCCF